MAFCPKISGGGGDLQIVVLLKKECSFSGVENVRWWGHSNATSWLKNDLYALVGGGDAKTFQFSLASERNAISSGASASAPYEPLGETFTT